MFQAVPIVDALSRTSAIQKARILSSWLIRLTGKARILGVREEEDM